jgi:MarR family transcriptional regulator, temperature-dependent positive regulator of motility
MFDHCLYFNTTALARRLDREWTEAFAPFGLTPSQGFMLRAVLERPGMAQSALAAEMSIARPTATRALDGLARLELIERQPGEADRREVTIHPTAQGRALQAGLNAASGAVTARLKRLLGPQAFVDVVSQVKGVRAALD